MIGLVNQRMIKVLVLVVNTGALLRLLNKYCLGAIAHLKKVIQQLMIAVRVSSTVILVVIEETSFDVVVQLLCAWISFEIGEKLFYDLVIFF